MPGFGCCFETLFIERDFVITHHFFNRILGHEVETEQVMRYYEDALKKAGLKVTSNTMQQDGKTGLGIVTGGDGEKRKAVVNATSSADGTNVGVTFTAAR